VKGQGSSRPALQEQVPVVPGFQCIASEGGGETTTLSAPHSVLAVPPDRGVSGCSVITSRMPLLTGRLSATMPQAGVSGAAASTNHSLIEEEGARSTVWSKLVPL
jgi:hypothetical protein